MRNGAVLAVAGGMMLMAGGAWAQEQCGAYPVGQDSYSCACPSGFSRGSVWGSGPYTADSSICTAALHAGAIGPEGGKVQALAAGPGESFTGTEANGVTTSNWGSYPNSFVFEVSAVADVAMCAGFPDDTERLTCMCDAAAATADGFVWGTSPYSGDSDICTAAVHGGLIGPEGGVVTVLRTAGLDAYMGTENNGIATFDWTGYPYSFVFDYNQ